MARRKVWIQYRNKRKIGGGKYAKSRGGGRAKVEVATTNASWLALATGWSMDGVCGEEVRTRSVRVEFVVGKVVGESNGITHIFEW